jgi:hypothetical protein
MISANKPGYSQFRVGIRVGGNFEQLTETEGNSRGNSTRRTMGSVELEELVALASIMSKNDWENIYSKISFE